MNDFPQIKSSLQAKQEMKFSAKLLQNIQIMRMSYDELSGFIKLQVDNNPFLKVTKKSDFVPSSSSNTTANSFPKSQTSGYRQGYSQKTPSNSKAPSNAAQQSTHDVITNTSPEHSSISHKLVEQLALVYSRKSKQFEIGKAIVTSVNSHGFLPKEKRREICKAMHVDIAVFLDVLQNIQQFDPSGVGCEDTADFLCLQLQLKEQESKLSAKLNYETATMQQYETINNTNRLSTAETIQLIRNHFHSLTNKDFMKISRITKFSKESIQNALTEIAKLSPFPISTVETYETYVVPEVAFTAQNEKVIVKINDGLYPSMGFDEELLKITQENKSKIKQKVNEAKQTIAAIEFRKSSLTQVANLIAKQQHEYFLQGPHMLQPYTITKAAAELGLNKSSVSRLVSAKYAETPYGVVPLRHFFSNSFIDFSPKKIYSRSRWTKSTMPKSGKVGRAQILLQIKKIETAFASEKVSDEKICAILNRQGFNIARRTVNKYRREIFQSKAGGSTVFANLKDKGL